MKITDLLNENAIQLNGIASSKEEVINKMVDLMMNNGNITDKENYKYVVMKREEEGKDGHKGKAKLYTEQGAVLAAV